MPRTFLALSLTTVAVLSLVTTGGAQAATQKVTVTVVGVSRTGAQVAVQSTVVPLSGNAEVSTGPTFRLVPGTYYVGASVPTMSGSNVASETIVARRVDVRSAGTIRLDARGGKLVSVWLAGHRLGSPNEEVGCLRHDGGVIYPRLGASVTYVKPVRGSWVSFDWTARTVGARNSAYDLAGGSSSGLPSNPVYRVRTSGLVKTVIEGRAGTLPDTTARWATSWTPPDGCTLPGAGAMPQLPFRATDYRSPGNWNTEVDTSHGLHTCSMTWVNRVYRAGHHYTVSFENAAHGPSQAVPVVSGTDLVFNPSYQLRDPLTQGYEYCADTTVSLSHDGRTLKTGHFTDLTQLFSAAVRSGRYELTVSSRQVVAGEARPAGLLSPRTTLTWRFNLVQGAEPVAVMSFLPQGLDIANKAAPGSVTKVRAWSTQSQFVVPPGPASRARTFTVQASYDGGKTWHAVPAVRHDGYWLLAVRNPASGYVSLRSTTVNALGDTSVQTIYQAYGIR